VQAPRSGLTGAEVVDGELRAPRARMLWGRQSNHSDDRGAQRIAAIDNGVQALLVSVAKPVVERAFVRMHLRIDLVTSVV